MDSMPLGSQEDQLRVVWTEVEFGYLEQYVENEQKRLHCACVSLEYGVDGILQCVRQRLQATVS